MSNLASTMLRCPTVSRQTSQPGAFLSTIKKEGSVAGLKERKANEGETGNGRKIASKFENWCFLIFFFFQSNLSVWFCIDVIYFMYCTGWTKALKRSVWLIHPGRITVTYFQNTYLSLCRSLHQSLLSCLGATYILPNRIVPFLPPLLNSNLTTANKKRSAQIGKVGLPRILLTVAES